MHLAREDHIKLLSRAHHRARHRRLERIAERRRRARRARSAHRRLSRHRLECSLECKRRLVLEHAEGGAAEGLATARRPHAHGLHVAR